MDEPEPEPERPELDEPDEPDPNEPDEPDDEPCARAEAANATDAMETIPILKNVFFILYVFVAVLFSLKATLPSAVFILNVAET